ncbi:MAG: hypothetical protein ACR2QT_04415 [Woeseiaceae bacterium]
MSLLFRLVLTALLLPATAFANDPYVPDELQDWQAWVLHEKEYRDCPMLFDRTATQRDDFVCVWPGELDLSVNADGGRFSQQWSVYAQQQWVRLPGNSNYWPHQVTANGRSVAVVLRDNIPSVFLEPGNYRVTGTFEWDERPGNLSLPWQTGLLSLTVDGERVDRPDRTNRGVFLGERKQETQARDSVVSNVYRLVSDNIPTRLTTVMQIQVSGGVREELFGPLLPDGFVPLSMNSDLPAKLEPDGNLRVQVRPGYWEIEVTARAADVLSEIGMPAPATNLPDTEIWSYESYNDLRVTAPEGLSPVDPLQVDVPADWDELPAFRVTPGDALLITERSRGIMSAENDLNLSRSMWLAFDRSSFVVNDEIIGTMRTDWRLDMAAPFALLTAAADFENLLITDGETEGQTGVELRYPNLNLTAVARMDSSGALPATGWETRFTSAETYLHLPPGHKLLAAPGVDEAAGSWASQWQLLDFFLVLIVAISTWRLFGRSAGIIALVALVLSFHEMEALAWLWLNVLIAIALMRVAPAGRLRKTVRVYQVASAAVLLLTLLPFVAGQLRVAIYPQLEAQRAEFGIASRPPRGFDAEDKLGALEVRRDAPASGALMQRQVAERAASSLEEIIVTGSSSAQKYSRYAPDAIVQAGAGIPSWKWNSYRLGWSGPVASDQTMRLMIMPRWLVSMMRFVEVLMLLMFVAVLAAEILKRQFTLPGGLRIGKAAANSIAAIGLVAFSLLPGQDAQAELPDAEILQALEARLLQAPECVPRCAEIVAADIAIDEQSIRMSLAIDAMEAVALPLPGSSAGWRPAAIVLNGTAAGQITRGPGQVLWIRLLPGRHSVVLSGPIPAVDSLEIPFATAPRVVEASSDGWFVAGIKDRRLLSGSLQLTRLQSDNAADGTARWESSRFPPFVEVTRTLQFDLDWRISTTVMRVAPVQGALTLELPLLEGESVITDNLNVTDGKILVSMAPNTNYVSWESNLQRESPLTLSAAASIPWQEQWAVVASNVWHTEFAGVPESESTGQADNARTALFHPRAGEELTITTSRPKGSAGATLAFDKVDLYTRHGDRISDTTLSLTYRSTRGSQHVVQLPVTAELTSVVIDGDKQSLRALDGKLVLPILPGEHSVLIVWRDAEDVTASTSTPEVDIGAAASNISLRLDLPRNRWLLGTNGPRLGPAVLYWSELIVLILAAVVLGRTRLAPLKTWHWLLLGLGFSTFEWSALAWVVLWLLASGARERWKADTSWWRFNLVQIGFAGLTVIALLTIVFNLPSGLLGIPDMHVAGNGSYGNALKWFADQSTSALPTASAWSVPLWVYKAFILGWSLWLSFALLRWLPWVWRSFSSQGYWRPRERRIAKSAEDSA